MDDGWVFCPYVLEILEWSEENGGGGGGTDATSMSL